MEELIKLVQVLGTPMGVVAAVSIALWRVLKWAGPRVDKITDRHIAFVDTIEKNNTKMAESVSGMTLRQDSHTNELAAIRAGIKCRYPLPPEPLGDRNGK